MKNVRTDIVDVSCWPSRYWHQSLNNLQFMQKDMAVSQSEEELFIVVFIVRGRVATDDWWTKNNIMINGRLTARLCAVETVKYVCMQCDARYVHRLYLQDRAFWLQKSVTFFYHRHSILYSEWMFTTKTSNFKRLITVRNKTAHLLCGQLPVLSGKRKEVLVRSRFRREESVDCKRTLYDRSRGSLC